MILRVKSNPLLIFMSLRQLSLYKIIEKKMKRNLMVLQHKKQNSNFRAEAVTAWKQAGMHEAVGLILGTENQFQCPYTESS